MGLALTKPASHGRDGRYRFSCREDGSGHGCNPRRPTAEMKSVLIPTILHNMYLYLGKVDEVTLDRAHNTS